MKEIVTKFTSDSQLLAELGERLIATPTVALGELIKNAYDADASKVNVWFSDEDKVLNVQDDGSGMTEKEFKKAWMTIAASHKLQADGSAKYKRPLTGSKGVGRFAVRMLGDSLELLTNSGGRTLKAEFPWSRFVAGKAVDEVPITYWVDVSDVQQGTLLRISALRQEWPLAQLQRVAGEVLDLLTPRHMAAVSDPRSSSGEDPGFRVYFTAPGQEQDVGFAAEEIYERYAIRLVLRLRGNKATFKYYVRGSTELKRYTFNFERNLVGRVDGDIRFLPKRPGLFAGLSNFDGRRAARWVRENSGVRVYDRGFRVLPYGAPDDDWLRLSEHVAARSRQWASSITESLFPRSERAPSAADDPALHLPANHQLLGAVAVRTENILNAPPEARQELLQPSMDRQGFVGNGGFRQLADLVRGGLEILAVLDLEETAARKKKEAKQRAESLQNDIQAAIVDVTAREDVPVGARRAIAKQLKKLSLTARSAEVARTEAEQSIEALSLLGVIAAFMTHEVTSMMRDVRSMLRAIRILEDGDDLEAARQSTARALEALKRHMEYVRTFTDNIRRAPEKRYKARPVLRQVKEQFDYFAAPRRIETEVDAGGELLAPPVPASIYSGIVLNLYTNALKALLAKPEGVSGTILISAIADGDQHCISVADTGVGVPAALHSRVFDPLFTTTAEDGPLGPGMGLGLYIVRRVARTFGGSATIVKPPAGFATCFEVRLPQ